MLEIQYSERLEQYTKYVNHVCLLILRRPVMLFILLDSDSHTYKLNNSSGSYSTVVECSYTNTLNNLISFIHLTS